MFYAMEATMSEITTEGAVWIDMKAWREARQEVGFAPAGLATDMILGLWAPSLEPLPGNADEVHALLACWDFKVTLEEVKELLPAAVRAFFVTLPNGRLVPSPLSVVR